MRAKTGPFLNLRIIRETTMLSSEGRYRYRVSLVIDPCVKASTCSSSPALWA